MKEDGQTTTQLGEDLEDLPKRTSVSSSWKNSCRILNIILFILCLAGFGFLTFKFISTFYIYSTVLDIKSERIQQFPTPALTYCSKYTLKFDKYCETYGDRCSRNNITNKVTPHKLPGYFENQPYLYSIYFNTDEAIEREKIKNSDEPFYNKFLFYDEWNSVLQVCYGYGYGLKWNGDLRNMTVRDYEIRVNWADFSVSFQQAENVLLDPPPYGTLYIHSPFLSFKTFHKKITVKSTHNYHIYTSLKEERLLPSPYDTDCTDYVSLWKKNEGTGPLSRDMCQHECLLGPRYFENTDEKLIAAGFCYDLMKVASKERRENDTIWKNCKCYLECKEDCLVLNYDFTYRERSNIGRHPYAYITIYIDGNKVQIGTHKPQYMDVERVSYVGGFLALCLGILIWTKKGILWRAVSKSKERTNSSRRRPTSKEEASEEEDKTKEIP